MLSQLHFLLLSQYSHSHPPPLQLLTNTDLLASSIILSCKASYISGITEYVTFRELLWYWPFSLSKIFWRLLQLVFYIDSYSIYVTLWIIFHSLSTTIYSTIYSRKTHELLLVFGSCWKYMFTGFCINFSAYFGTNIQKSYSQSLW